jgi:hypothetical protein
MQRYLPYTQLILLISTVAFLGFKLILPSNPNIYYLSILDLILVLIILASAKLTWWWGYQSKLINKGVTVFLILLIAIGATVAGYPDYKTKADASAYNNKFNDVVAAATLAAEGEMPNEVWQRQLNTQIAKSESSKEAELLRESALEAYAARQRGESDEQIKARLNPQVEVSENKWNCIAAGCSFGQGDLVWTVRLDQYYLSWMVAAIAMLMLNLELGSLNLLMYAFNRKDKKRK